MATITAPSHCPICQDRLISIIDEDALFCPSCGVKHSTPKIYVLIKAQIAAFDEKVKRSCHVDPNFYRFTFIASILIILNWLFGK